MASLLGVTPSSLLTLLTKRHVNFAGTVVAKQLSLQESLAARDAVAAQLYSSVFKWLLSGVNRALHKKFIGEHTNLFGGREANEDHLDGREKEFDVLNGAAVISIMDFPGFEYCKPASISGLCRNYQAERLFQHYTQLFRPTAVCWERNGVTSAVPSLELRDNSEVLRLLESKPGGVFSVFNDQMKLKSRQLDAKVASALYSHDHGGQGGVFEASKKDRRRLWFRIRHFNHPVCYEVSGFKGINKMQPSAELVEGVRGSSVEFVRGLLDYCEVKHGGEEHMKVIMIF